MALRACDAHAEQHLRHEDCKGPGSRRDDAAIAVSRQADSPNRRHEEQQHERAGHVHERAVSEVYVEVARPAEGQELSLAGREVLPAGHVDGACVLRDLGSTNGTALNDEPAPIAPDTDVAVSDGDRIRLGAWTTITVRRR